MACSSAAQESEGFTQWEAAKLSACRSHRPWLRPHVVLPLAPDAERAHKFVVAGWVCVVWGTALTRSWTWHTLHQEGTLGWVAGYTGQLGGR